MTDGARRWQGIVREWERSGQSQTEFCRLRGINGGTFSWWKRQLAAQRPEHAHSDRPTIRLRAAASKAEFVELRPGGAGACVYEIALPGGRLLRIPERFDPQVLARLIAAVEAAPVTADGRAVVGC